VAHEARIGVPAGKGVEVVVTEAPEAQPVGLEDDGQ
jgi:hypothetical protein